jgi:hypothetical protein
MGLVSGTRMGTKAELHDGFPFGVTPRGMRFV